MSEEDMEAWVNEWFSTHAVVGAPAAATVIPAVVFSATGTQFDADGNLATLVDTVYVRLGDTVQWKRINGAHTVTNGLGESDPLAGTLFDQPLVSSNVPFNYTFEKAGLYPFFCRPHEFFEMKGVVCVEIQTPVRTTSWGGLKRDAR